MVFSTTTLFKGIPCPEESRCRLTNCIYGHHGPTLEPAAAAAAAASALHSDTRTQTDSSEPVSKRRKVTYESLDRKPPSRADVIRTQLAAQRNAVSAPKDTQRDKNASPSTAASSAATSLPSLVKTVSPPPVNGIKGEARDRHGDVTKPSPVEALNPRLIPHDPAGHAKRSLYLKHLYAEMLRVNEGIGKLAAADKKRSVFLSPPDLIKLALDDEEKIAREQPVLYGNVLKQRVAALKKMQPPWDEWVHEIESKQRVPVPAANKEEKPIETGLSLEQELLVLPHLVVQDQKPLSEYGYVPIPPTAEEAAEAAAAVEASRNYEVCDRCAGRFQVFPDRNEKGSLTSSGPCMHHPDRKAYPQRSKTDKETGPKEPYYPCCNENVGTLGCTRKEDHVFKTSSPARLAAVLPFIVTPSNSSPPQNDGLGKPVKAVSFDCEMGYTALGMELIRLTAVSWPYGAELIDVLVRPYGAVIDLNSRFSGVFPEHYQKAIPYDRWLASSRMPAEAELNGPQSLPVVSSPEKAREVLCSFLTPETPLIGHSIDNDLNVVRLCHPTIVDTAILFPHARGLPLRLGLRMLSQKHLRRNIQSGGERGHDSKEDAVATGDLVRVKVGDKWKLLRATGWQMGNGQLIAPPAKEKAGEHTSAQKKRKAAPFLDGADDGNDDSLLGVEDEVQARL